MLLIGFVAGVLAGALQVLHVAGPLRAVEASAQDLALRARTPESYLQVPGEGQVAVTRDPRDAIVLVAIDEKTIAELGAYNGGYPRQLMAELVEQLLTGPARAIALDIGFFEPTSDDQALATALDHARQVPTRVVLAGVGLGSTEQGRYSAGLLPVETLRARSDVGLSNVQPDERGTIRAMPLLADVQGVERPTFGLAAVAAYLRRPQPVDARRADEVEVAGRRVPVDQQSAVRINFFGPPYRTFPTLSLVDVLKGRANPDQWRGKLVLVGASGAAGLADDYWTPVSVDSKMAGVEIHANVAATLLSTQFLREAPQWVEVGLIVVLAVVVALLAGRLPIALATTATVVVLGAAAAITLWVFFARGLQLPLANPMLGGVTAFIGTIAWRVAFEQRQARALQKALASVIPPSVAQEIARAPQRVKLGGERRTITLLFTDLADFTTYSESVPAETVSRMVSDYLAAMTQVVFDYGGTVDKFVGDEVMALWNAPLDDPAHARHACEAALTMQSALARLNEAWHEHGIAPQRMRIGIHTGVVSVGNMGTAQRFAYTALGDNVNLAARLEPLNKEYGTSVCVSAATLHEAGDGFATRFLDLVAVKGKRTPVAVYELLGRSREVDCAGFVQEFEAGVKLYQAREFARAAEKFRAAMSAAPKGVDAPSALYIERCAQLQADPPGPEWDGVFVMLHK